jgi:hypothetical protein
MDVRAIDGIKAKLLREAIKTRKDQLGGKPSILSVIYPAMKHGPNFPPARHDPQAGPEVDDHGEENEGDRKIDKDAEDGAGTQKVPAPGDWAKDLAWPGGVRGKFMGKSYKTTSPNQCEDKHQTTPFVQRCVAAITGGAPSSKDDLSGAFAKCNATKNKSGKPLDSNALTRPGYGNDKAKFVKAINTFKKAPASGYD